MPCTHPLKAWQTPYGAILFTAPQANHWAKTIAREISLPCNNCINCIKAHAQAWALRCRMELQQHDAASFTTLTYEERYLPPTLSKTHLQRYLKRLRKATNAYIKFFASGEYGDKRRRPHYHLLLYGLMADTPAIQDKWPYGHTYSDIVTPDRISYCAGYTDKKAEQRYRAALPYDSVSPHGEPYRYQPPFIQMSRNPGIGAAARDWPDAWQLYAIKDGHKMAVPRYYKQAWKYQATDQEIQHNKQLLQKHALARYNIDLNAAEKIALKQQEISASKRRY